MDRLIDLHAHYPMHTHFPPDFTQQPAPVGKEIEYFVAQHLLNYQNGKPRVSLDELLAGSPGGIGSVLYDPDDEFFRDATPRPEAFPNLIAQMNNVEAEVAGRVTVVRNPAQLQACLDNGTKFLFHCVEGGFELGGDPANVDTLAARGVAYVIVAHLFYRGVATCQNALPYVPDSLFSGVLNPDQPAGVRIDGPRHPDRGPPAGARHSGGHYAFLRPGPNREIFAHGPRPQETRRSSRRTDLACGPLQATR